jgi:hypothetical protein
MTKVEPGQLRRWDSDSEVVVHRDMLFTVLCVIPKPAAPAWYYLINGERDWHFEKIIEEQSEVISEAR